MKYVVILLFFLVVVAACMVFMGRSKKGRIILLNGVSSSGKTAIIQELSKIDRTVKILKIDDWFPEVLHKKAESLGWKKELNIDPWLYLYDYVYKKTGEYYFNTQVREMLFDEVTDFYQKAKEFSAGGYDVLIDNVLEYEKEYTTFNEFFKHDDPIKILVYCPMDVLLERVEKRNQSQDRHEHRTSFQSFEQFPAIFKVQEQESETIVDRVNSKTLLKTLEKSIQELLDNKIPDPYIPKLEEFKKNFIKQFKLDTQAEIMLVAKHSYNVILNSSKNNPAQSAQEIVRFLQEL